MTKYNFREYTDDLIAIIRTEEKDYGPGLPPSHSQCIMMNPSELDDLKKSVNEYADKRRSERIQSAD